MLSRLMALASPRRRVPDPKFEEPPEPQDLCSWITKVDHELKSPCSGVSPKLREGMRDPHLKCHCHGQEINTLIGWHLVHDGSGDSYEGEW